MITDRLTRRLKCIYDQRTSLSRRFGRLRLTTVGLETRTDPADYQWDGMNRGGRRESAFVLFQYTLNGAGTFEHDGVRRPVEPGQAFIAIVPSEHRYFLPADSAGWTFFWFILPHPYITQRVGDRLESTTNVFTFAPEGPLIAAVSRLFEGVCLDSFRDEFAWERAAFDFLFEFERSCTDRAHEQPTRDQLLADVAAHVSRHEDRAMDIEELAAAWKMSRSHFSHYFKAATGLSPARYLLDLRLNRATHELTHTQDKLQVVARRTGFADANHLCKVFRRYFHVSPGEYRKQVG